MDGGAERDRAERKRVAEFRRGVGPEVTVAPTFKAIGGEDVRFDFVAVLV